MHSRVPPMVSVVLPTYNRASLIARSVQSVLNQSFADFEVLLVDDGSADDTAGVVAGFSDPRVTYIRLPKNAGAAAARNVGIRISKGKFLAFQDSDDEWLPEKLIKHISVFERGSHRLGVVYSDMQRIGTDGFASYHSSPAIIPGRLVDPSTQFYQTCNLGIQSTVIKRKCLDTVGCFNEDLPALEDLELFLRLSRRFDFFLIPEALVRYYETDGLSKARLTKWLARRQLVTLYFNELLASDPYFLLKECLWILKERIKFTIEKRVTINPREPT